MQVQEEEAQVNTLDSILGGMQESRGAGGGASQAGRRTASSISAIKRQVDPFQTLVLENDTVVFFRSVWGRQGRTLQGFVVDGKKFLSEVVEAPFRSSTLAAVGNVLIGHAGNVFARFDSPVGGRKKIRRGAAAASKLSFKAIGYF